MQIHLNKSPTLFLAALSLVTLCSSRAPAQSHPQEVLDLIGSYEALAMKIRPVQDRMAVPSSETGGSESFRPEGVPLRAQVATATSDGDSASESRVSEQLRHRDRAVNSDDGYRRVRARLSALEEKVRSELERIGAPGLGMPREDEDSGVRFGDGRSGARPPRSRSPDRPAASDAVAIDDETIIVARRALSELEREYAALERQVSAIESR
jgi:hypothetical protein